jgi:hypothetical protein
LRSHHPLVRLPVVARDEGVTLAPDALPWGWRSSVVGTSRASDP